MLEGMKNKRIGEDRTEAKRAYEYELEMEIIGDKIRKALTI